MSIVGFDFGTTNSLLSFVRGERVINFLDEDRRPIPSVVCYEGGQKIVGRAAKELLAQAGLGIQGNIVRSPKMYLGRDSVFIEDVERSPVDIVADVVRHVVSEAMTGGQRKDLGDITGAVVTIPVDMQGFRRRALRDAFRLAGVRILQYVHEPLAALYGFFRISGLQNMLRRYDRKLILVFDWGGGTLDLTLCRLMGDMLVQIKNDGTDDVGGDVFDETIMNHLIQKVCTQRGIDENVEIYPGAKARLLSRCERAKIDLSMRGSSQVYVNSFFQGGADEDFDYGLNQRELEEIVSPLLEKGFKRIAKILDDAGYASEQVALCIATGGMSNMPVVKRRLHEWFGPQRVQIPDGTATLIAEGAAWIAHDQVGLQLAKNVELELARNSYFPMIKAGTSMPKGGEVQQECFQLYCTDPRDGVAKFQICSPASAGKIVTPGEPRNHLENITVKVDRLARPFTERLELAVSINDDLILQAHARSLNIMDEDRCEIHNLEFGLKLTPGNPTAHHDIDAGTAGNSEKHSIPAGSLSLRSNIANRVDELLVPGEYLYEYHPRYFDVGQNPPEIQVQERLYYQPCALCGRISNDPLCRCSAEIAARRLKPSDSLWEAHAPCTEVKSVIEHLDGELEKDFRKSWV